MPAVAAQPGTVQRSFQLKAKAPRVNQYATGEGISENLIESSGHGNRGLSQSDRIDSAIAGYDITNLQRRFFQSNGASHGLAGVNRAQSFVKNLAGREPQFQQVRHRRALFYRD
jgi:hypothetical protein